MAAAWWPLPPSSFAVVSQIGRDIFHGRLFNLIYICSLGHSYTRTTRSSDQFCSPFPAKRSFRFSRLKRDDSVNLLDLGRPRQRRFMDRERYLRVPIPRVEIYLRPPRRNYEQQAKVPTVTILLLFSSSSLSFSFSSIFFFSILFGPLSIIVMKVHRNVLSNMRRAISRVCRETHGVENSRKCSCHRKCERYSFTKLIISLRWKGRRRKGEILGFGEIKLAVETFFLVSLYVLTRDSYV